MVFAYVVNGSGLVSVIDTKTHSVIATVPVGQLPSNIKFTPDGKLAYVTNALNGSTEVSVIDTKTHSVIATIEVGNAPSFCRFHTGRKNCLCDE
ncbi:YncE family protein [Cytobacillus sp. Hm23]